jgi:hypothetical protein
MQPTHLDPESLLTGYLPWVVDHGQSQGTIIGQSNSVVARLDGAESGSQKSGDLADLG